VTLTFRGFKKILNPWWLNRRGKIIGGWVEVDRWLQNFCSQISVTSQCDFVGPDGASFRRRSQIGFGPVR